MRDFLFNLLLLLGLVFFLYIIAPDMMKQVTQLFGGLGLLPIIIVLVLLSAIPKRRRK